MKKFLFSSILLCMVLVLFMLFGTIFAFAQEVTIKYITLGGVQMESMDEMVSKFEKENPGIKVKVEDWPFVENYTKYVTSIKAGNPPDCGYVWITNLDEFRKRGALVPVDEYISDALKQDFYKALVDQVTLEDGKMWATPLWFSTRLFMYRKDILDKHGIGIPRSPEDLLAMAKALHNPPEMYGFCFPGGSTRHIWRWFTIQLWGRGGSFFTPDMKKVTFNDKAGVEALTFLNEMKPYFQPGYLQHNEHDLQIMFYQGKVPAIQLFYSVITGGEIEKNPDWKIVAEFPPVEKKLTLGIMDVFCIFKTTPEKQKAAGKWLEFIYRNEYRTKANILQGFQPVKKSVASDFMQTDLLEKYPEVKKFLDSTPYAQFEPLHPLWEKIQDILGRYIQKCLLGDLTPQEALDAAAKEANESLAE